MYMCICVYMYDQLNRLVPCPDAIWGGAAQLVRAELLTTFSASVHITYVYSLGWLTLVIDTLSCLLTSTHVGACLILLA